MLSHFKGLEANCRKIGKISFAIGIFLTGCLQAQDKSDKSEIQDKQTQARMKEEEETRKLAKDVIDEITALRGLKFSKPIDAGVFSVKELREFITKEFETGLPPEKADAYQKLLVKFGIITPQDNVKEILINLYTSQIAGFYDPRTKQLKMKRRKDYSEEEKVIDQLLKALIGKSYAEMIMSHELTHAAQDQNFDLLTIPVENDFNEDLGLGTRAVVEGDAMKIMWRYVFGIDGENKGTILEIPVYKPPQMPGVPPFLVEQMYLPYSDGYKFVFNIYSNSEWNGVNSLYSDLPSSTEQILHPEKYLGKRDFPTDITLPDVAGVLGQGWVALGKPNVWGEYSIRLILQANNLQKTDDAAAGWDGDKYVLFVEKGETKDPTLVWFTTWDTPKDAEEFFDAYKLVLDKKYKNIAGQSSEGIIRYPLLDGFVTTLEIKGKDVLLIDYAPKGKLDALSKAIWEGVKKEEIKKVERLKSQKN